MGEAAVGFSSGGDAALPRVFGRLWLLRLIARGGMGDVSLAATTGIEGAERAVIVKTVRRDHIHDGSFIARFLDEARVQSQLNHPGVAQVLEASTDENGEPYTVVEFVEGRSLSDLRQRAIQLGVTIEWPDAVAIAIEMAQALAHVHERSGPDGLPLGIVHRDLSPQNVMVGYAGEVKLIDFGTARGQNRRCHTVAGVVFAKPGYVAPEVARQQIGDGRIDVYALGIMLWELCKGQRFLNGDPQKHLEDAAAGKVHIPKLAGPLGAPLLLDEVIAKLTMNDPDERFESAARAVVDLARLLALAPSSKNGERGVRARIAALMRALWPHEPGRSRAEFARLLEGARKLKRDTPTPSASKVSEAVAARMAPEDPSILAGTPYRLAKKIGEGSSGVVYEGEHVELGRPLAIKLLSPEHSSATDAIERFRREARAVAKLSHPNLAVLYDFGKSLDGRVYLAMELLRGETLDKRVKRGPLAWRVAVRLAIEVSRALEAAHGAGLVHRDLKPANLFLTSDGGLKLLDFGVAMALADTVGQPAEKRQKGFAIFGTPEYMAPEQVAGEAVDGRCDLYALGCVLYELLSGTRAFEGPSSVVVMGKQLREPPEPLRARAPAREIPRELDAAVMCALAKRPDARFATATAMREALEAVLAAPAVRRSKLRRAAKVAVFSGALLGVAGLAARVVATRGQDVATIWPLAAPTAAAAAGSPASSAANPGAAVAHGEASPPAAMLAVAAPSPASPSGEGGDADGAPTTREGRARALTEARAHTRGAMTDPGALRGWAWAAYHAGELKEARRAAQVWSLHDGTNEPRLFTATVLEASGHRLQAKAVLEEWLQVHPEDDAVKDRLGRLSGDRSARGLAHK
jgi:serine/threonine-protein kinase